MNDIKEERKDAITKSLAVLGFIVIILLVSWLSVKFVQMIPNAFSSLASLAGSLQEEQLVEEEPELTPIILIDNITAINAGETVELSWENIDRAGSYTFTYSCKDGVAVDLLNIVGIQSITCNTNYNIGDRTSLSFIVDSEKEEETTLDYTLSFLGTNDISTKSSIVSSLTVNKEDITTDQETKDIEETPADTEPTNDEVVKETTTPAVTPSTPRPTTQYIYAVPTSDPNGRTDLGVKFIQSGSIIGNRFISGTIEQNESGAIQFAVKNYGTKTSDDWSYSVSLPNGGTYEVDDQAPLKPNEEAVISVGFPTDSSSLHTFRIEVDEKTDSNRLNDQTEQLIFFIR